MKKFTNKSRTSRKKVRSASTATTLHEYLLSDHGGSRLGTYVGRVTKIGQKQGLEKDEIVAALGDFWKSEEGIAMCERLVEGAISFSKNEEGKSHE